jgi:multicomponent Na+:H+ antiporter subunit A
MVISAAVLTVVITRSRLLAVCGLGVIGAGIALIFLSFGAPDVALTQLLVETLTVIIVSIILLRLPRLRLKPFKYRPQRIFDALLALGAGILVTTLLLAVLSNDLDRSVTAPFSNKTAIWQPMDVILSMLSWLISEVWIPLAKSSWWQLQGLPDTH